jgi:predicted RNA-binding Zn ribbon-like protein
MGVKSSRRAALFIDRVDRAFRRGMLVSEGLNHAGQCIDGCESGWLLLDTSKNRIRRWCDVRDCGNQARQRRFPQRALGDSA